jgi:hypothetical protein
VQLVERVEDERRRRLEYSVKTVAHSAHRQLIIDEVVMRETTAHSSQQPGGT